MKTVTLSTTYQEYDCAAQMDAQDQELVSAAIQAQQSSYAPYSHFNVGAAVRMEDGTIVKGSNQENSAYPSGLCAERTAMFAAGAAHPGKAMTAIAIAGGFSYGLDDAPCTPCGACRQVMAEYQMASGKPMAVIMAGASKILKFSRVDDILPFIFDSFTQPR